MNVLERLWPRTLFGRLGLILFSGLALAHVLAFGLILYERAGAAKMMMFSYVPKDIASSVAILERVPAAEREAWLPRISRTNYRYSLGPAPDGESIEPEAEVLLAAVASELGASYRTVARAMPDANNPLQLFLQTQLQDGTSLAIEFAPSGMMVSPAALGGLTLQLLVLLIACWIAVRFATRPLSQLARAADRLRPDGRSERLPEAGPVEVLQATQAFNAMQQRVADYLAERLQLLAAISHDLQTPITRMRLRADLLEDEAVRDKFHTDLAGMQALVAEGIAYARSAQSISEPPRRIDVQALLDSIVGDYADAGRPIHVGERAQSTVVTRPNALRRVLTNLIDNALKFGGDAEIRVQSGRSGQIIIEVCDRGPGIPMSELDNVMQPFYRLEDSRNRRTGGTGLGLAIAQQLTRALGGALTLSNREGGGLEARLVLQDLVDDLDSVRAASPAG